MPLEPTDPEPLHARIRWGNVVWVTAALAAAALVLAGPRLQSRPPRLPPPVAEGAAQEERAKPPVDPLSVSDIVAAQTGAVAEEVRDGAGRVRPQAQGRKKAKVGKRRRTKRHRHPPAPAVPAPAPPPPPAGGGGAPGAAPGAANEFAPG